MTQPVTDSMVRGCTKFPSSFWPSANPAVCMGGPDNLMQLIIGEPLVRWPARIALAVGPVITALSPAPHPRYYTNGQIN